MPTREWSQELSDETGISQSLRSSSEPPPDLRSLSHSRCPAEGTFQSSSESAVVPADQPQSSIAKTVKRMSEDVVSHLKRTRHSLDASNNQQNQAPSMLKDNINVTEDIDEETQETIKLLYYYFIDYDTRAAGKLANKARVNVSILSQSSEKIKERDDMMTRQINTMQNEIDEDRAKKTQLETKQQEAQEMLKKLEDMKTGAFIALPSINKAARTYTVELYKAVSDLGKVEEEMSAKIDQIRICRQMRESVRAGMAREEEVFISARRDAVAAQNQSLNAEIYRDLVLLCIHRLDTLREKFPGLKRWLKAERKEDS